MGIKNSKYKCKKKVLKNGYRQSTVQPRYNAVIGRRRPYCGRYSEMNNKDADFSQMLRHYQCSKTDIALHVVTSVNCV